MRAVARYSVIFLPSSTISNSETRAHFMPRTVLAASATAFSAALAKLSLEDPTMSMTFCAMDGLLLLDRRIYRWASRLVLLGECGSQGGGWNRSCLSRAG